MKKNLFSNKLKKTAGSRLENVDTVMLENECNKKEIIGKKTIKSSDEEGMDDRHFVHVLESFMKKGNYPVIVKIHHKRSPFINNELRAYEHLRDFQNCVKKICDFSCLDDKERWKSPIKKPVEFCNNKTDELHFIVLEYIENGNIENRIKKMKIFSEGFAEPQASGANQNLDSLSRIPVGNPTTNELASLILQIELMILELGCNYHMLHGDLHSGNILISDIENRRIHYTIDKREYRISSYGIIPLFIDFGRSKISKEAIPIEFVLEDVYMTIQIILRYIPDDNIIQKIHDFIHTQSVTNTYNPHKLILDTKTFFTSLGRSM